MLQGNCSHLHILPRDLIPIFTRMALGLGSIVTSSKTPLQGLTNKIKHPIIGPCIFLPSHWQHHKNHAFVCNSLIRPVCTPHLESAPWRQDLPGCPSLSLERVLACTQKALWRAWAWESSPVKRGRHCVPGLGVTGCKEPFKAFYFPSTQ